jgi:hypothetical protein
MYLIGLLSLLILGAGARLLYIESFPFGFSGHAIVHCSLRRRLYELIFVKPWNEFFWVNFRAIVVEDQHGPQSLVEALLTPIFGFGLTESRLIVATLGVISIALAIWWGSVAINRWFGLAVGFALSFAPYHLTYSRNGDSEHINIYVHGFFLLLAAQRVVVFGRVWDWLLLGIALGTGFYVYASTQLLCLIVLGLVCLVTLRRTLQTKWYYVCSHLIALSLPAVLLMWPAIRNSWARGRLLPVRVPYGTPSYEVSRLSQLPQQLKLTWDEVFTRGTDPWYTLANGCLHTWPTILAIPGILCLGYLAFSAWRQRSPQSSDAVRRSVIFCFLLATAMVLLGGLPGALSPAPHFRRLTILAMGIDICKGAGIFGIAAVLNRFLPRPVAIVAVLVALIPYAQDEWQTFYYKAAVSESTSKNCPISIVREITTRLKQGQQAVVVLGDHPHLLNKRDIREILEFDLGYPQQLPNSITLLTFSEVSSSLTNAIIPIDVYYRIKHGQLSPLPMVTLSNERIVSNRLGETHVLADISPVQATEGSIQPGAPR